MYYFQNSSFPSFSVGGISNATYCSLDRPSSHNPWIMMVLKTMLHHPIILATLVYLYSSEQAGNDAMPRDETVGLHCHCIQLMLKLFNSTISEWTFYIIHKTPRRKKTNCDSARQTWPIFYSFMLRQATKQTPSFLPS